MCERIVYHVYGVVPTRQHPMFSGLQIWIAKNASELSMMIIKRRRRWWYRKKCGRRQSWFRAPSKCNRSNNNIATKTRLYESCTLFSHFDELTIIKNDKKPNHKLKVHESVRISHAQDQNGMAIGHIHTLAKKKQWHRNASISVWVYLSRMFETRPHFSRWKFSVCTSFWTPWPGIYASTFRFYFENKNNECARSRAIR